MNELGFRILSNGVCAIKQTQNGFLPNPETLSIPPSFDLQQIIRARLAIRDPRQCIDIVFFENLPERGHAQTAYTIGDGAYYYWDAQKEAWELFKLALSDARLDDFIKQNGLLSAEILAIDFIIAGLDPSEFLQSMSAGAESFHFASYGETLNWYEKQKTLLAGANGFGKYFKTKSKSVGGINEDGANEY
jgi:hypothetical protein